MKALVVILGLLTIIEQPPEDGKRRILKMENFKIERTVIKRS